MSYAISPKEHCSEESPFRGALINGSEVSLPFGEQKTPSERSLGVFFMRSCLFTNVTADLPQVALAVTANVAGFSNVFGTVSGFRMGRLQNRPWLMHGFIVLE